MDKPQVKSYRMKARNGNHIRVATMVVFGDGSIVRFTERMGAKEALKQAEEFRRPQLTCPLCQGSGWLHGAQEWTPERMRKGTPYKSARCDCKAA